MESIMFGAIPKFIPSYSKYIPLCTPAIDKEYYTVDKKLLNSRIAILASAAFVMLSTAVLLSNSLAVIGTTALVASLLLPAIAAYDLWLSNLAVDKLAVDDSITNATKPPSLYAPIRIATSQNAARLFVNSEGFINNFRKVNSSGPGLLVHITKFEILKLFLDKGVKVTDTFKEDGTKGETTVFQSIIERGDVEALDYVCKNNLVKVEEFSKDQQFGFWIENPDPKIASLLQDSGFNVNVINSQGITPLFALLSQVHHFILNRSKFTDETAQEVLNRAISTHAKQIRFLIEKCGANPNMEVEVDGNKTPICNSVHGKLMSDILSSVPV